MTYGLHHLFWRPAVPIAILNYSTLFYSIPPFAVLCCCSFLLCRSVLVYFTLLYCIVFRSILLYTPHHHLTLLTTLRLHISLLQHGSTPLIMAAEGCHVKVVRILLNKGANINAAKKVTGRSYGDALKM